jgi:hypothetical protein
MVSHMPKFKIDGKIDSKPVKVIVRTKELGTIYMAKPKNFDINTPHFEISVDGKMEVHEDSPNGSRFRVMNMSEIWSGSIDSGITFAENKGMDIAVLPMHETATGFSINTSPSGSYVTIPTGSQWCLMAVGTYGPWQVKPKH